MINFLLKHHSISKGKNYPTQKRGVSSIIDFSSIIFLRHLGLGIFNLSKQPFNIHTDVHAMWLYDP